MHYQKLHVSASVGLQEIGVCFLAVAVNYEMPAYHSACMLCMFAKIREQVCIPGVVK